ncbi:LacI family DNA-binding transcriptional regulator [Arthrobacter sp. Sr24]
MTDTKPPSATPGSTAPSGSSTPKIRPGKSSATIYDIAELAGVNPSTVSRALSKPGRVSAKTQQKIMDAAAELNYQVNVFARALPTGRTQTVGLIVSDITNPAFFDVIRGAETTAAARDYTLMLAESTESADHELTAARRMLATVDGLILASPRLSDEEIKDLAAKKPVVLVNRRVDGIASVVADTETGVAEAVRHLAAMGHSSISYVAGPERSWMSQRRWESIKARCDWHGMKLSQVASGMPTVEGGRRAAAVVKDGEATAVFCYNDLMAIGLMRELQGAGVCVPEQLSILGFDNIFGSDFTTPPLSTIKSPLHELGVAALTSLLEFVVPGDSMSQGTSDSSAVLHTELVLRGSTGVAHAS